MVPFRCPDTPPLPPLNINLPEMIVPHEMSLNITAVTVRKAKNYLCARLMFLVTKLVGQIPWLLKTLPPLNGQRTRVQGTVLELNYMLTRLALCPTGPLSLEIRTILLIHGWRRLTPLQPLPAHLFGRNPNLPHGPDLTSLVPMDPLTLPHSLLIELT